MKKNILLLSSLFFLLFSSYAFSGTITLNSIIRDFNDSHPDFQYKIADDRGIVAPNLGPDSKPVYANPGGVTTTTTGKANFDQWYNDVQGVNLSMPYSLVLTETSSGSNIYSYSNNSFFPIDNMLLGNQGRNHNYHFTLELHALFDYTLGTSFTFTGDDDLWIFVDKKLVVDLGGVHAAQTATVNLDTLGLITGQTYSFDLFFAERHTTQSNFTFQTSALLRPVPLPAAAWMLGAGLIALVGVRRRMNR